VLEFCGCRLRTILCRSDAQLTATSIESIARQVAAALTYLHNSKGLVHLDVKSANILFRQDDGRAALSDFGMTEPIKTKKPRFGTYVTANYRAPELWGHRDQTPGSLLTPAADAFSYGCVLWELVAASASKTGTLFPDPQTDILSYAKEIRERQAAGWTIRTRLSGAWAAAVQTLLHPDPVKRRWKDIDALALPVQAPLPPCRSEGR
jgi:serine/threonine protein kinase